MKWVTVKKAAELSGYSEKAIEAAAETGFLRFGDTWLRAPDRTRLINWEALVEIGEPLPVYLVTSREMRVRHATPPWADRDAMRMLYRQAKRISQDTGVPHQVDHEIPIMGDMVCGLHTPGNLRIITRAENCSKSNRWEPE